MQVIKKICIVLTLLIAFGQLLCSQDIHKSAADGDLETVKKLLREDPGLLNSLDKDGRTPLLRAVLSPKEDVFKFLIAEGADVNLVDRDGMSPLLFVSYIGLTDWADLLMSHGAQIDSQAHVFRYAPLHLAARAGEKGLCRTAHFQRRKA